MDDLEERLLKLDLATVPSVPHKDQRVKCVLKRIKDGDTMVFVTFYGQQPLEINVRVAEIDAPETALRKGVTQLEKKAGLAVKRYVIDLMPTGKLYEIKILKHGTYGGRYISEVYLPDGESLSDHLVSKGYAREYKEDKKKAWDPDFLQKIINNIK